MPDVLIYTRPFCPYCSRAVSLLQRKGVDFKEVDDAAFDADKKREMIQKAHGRSTFPQIFIGERHIGGCDDLMALDRAGELDKLLESGVTTLRVAAVQLRTPATLSGGLAHAAPLVREAADAGATLIVTPEGTNILQQKRPLLLDEIVTQDEDPVVQGLAAIAVERGVRILVGSALVRRSDGGCANRSILIGPDGAIEATYDKIHMFDVDLPNGDRYRESSLYIPGERAVTADVPHVRLGLSICYDMRFPELFRRLGVAGADLITLPAAFTRPTGEAHWETLIRARAIETGAYVVGAAQGGVHEDGRGTWGRSVIVGPWGEIVAKLDHDEPGVLVADLDLDAVAKARASIPNLKNAREFAGPDAVA